MEERRDRRHAILTRFGRRVLRSRVLLLLAAAAGGSAAWTVALPAAAASIADGPAADVFVAPDGNDGNTGRLASPGTSDGPVATLGRAVAIIRHLRLRHQDRALTVLLRGGTYALSDPIVLTEADSGTEHAPLVIAGYPGEDAVLSGGSRLFGWHAGKGALWQAPLPAATGLSPTELYIDGRRAHRPRMPKDGYYSIQQAVPPSPRAIGRGSDRFVFAAGAIDASWPKLGETEITFLQTWTSSTFRLRAVDMTTRTAELYGATRSPQDWDALKAGVRYRLENVREAFSDPGEFLVDKATGTISYIARADEHIGAVAVIPRLEHLLVLTNAFGQGEPVRYIRFERLIFAHTSRVLPFNGIAEQQAAVDESAAILAIGAQNVTFDHVTVRDTGGYGIALGPGCKSNQIQDSVFADLGAGGIMVGHLAPSATLPGLTHPRGDPSVTDNMINRNVIAGGGRLSPGAVGIWVGKASRTSIIANDIADLYYSGVSVGWTWGYGDSATSDNRIAGNHIHDLGQGILSDLAGVYLLGKAPGTVVSGNVIHDIRGAVYGGFGFNADEGSSDMLFKDNIVYKTSHEAFGMNFGKDNVVENNIFALSGTSTFVLGQAEPHRSLTIRHNRIVAANAQPLFRGAWMEADADIDDNLYWRAEALPAPTDTLSWADWKARLHHDVRSIVSDPQFRDAAHGDFSSPDGAPGLARPSPISVARPAADVTRFKIDKAF